MLHCIDCKRAGAALAALAAMVAEQGAEKAADGCQSAELGGRAGDLIGLRPAPELGLTRAELGLVDSIV